MTLLARLSRMMAGEATDVLTGDDTEAVEGEPTPAAVLVPVVSRAEPGLLLTVRTSTLRHHAGQIAFPGGRLDPGEDAVAAALREAHEEVGLDPARVEIVGTADPYRTITGFAVTPVIGIIPPNLPLVPHDGEVADIFEAPLGFVTDPANHILREVEWQGKPRRYYEIVWEDRRIWGATAAMIVNLSRRLGEAG